MQRKTFTRTLLAAAALAVALPGLAQAQAMKLTLGHGAAPGNPRHEAAVKFAETLKAKTAGRIEVQVAPSAQLGDDAAMVTAVRTGALDMTANSQGAVSVAVPEYAAYGMPFMFSTPRAGLQAAGRPAGPGAGAEVGRQGHGGAGLLGQRHSPHDQQQTTHHQGRRHEGPEDAHPA